MDSAYDDMLDQCMILIAKPNQDKTFTISNKTGTKEELFSFIRNKIAHGDYYYNDNNKTIVLNSDVGDIEIKINLFIQFYNMLIPMLTSIYKDNEYTRSILLNKTKQLENKVLKTEKEVEDYLRLFTYKKFILTSYDGNVIPMDIKSELEHYIRKILSLQNMKQEYKSYEQKVIKLFAKKGYLLNIENRKIKDKETISKIKDGLLSLKIDENYEKTHDLNYEYGEIISKIIEPKYAKNGLVVGTFLNLEVLKGIIMLDKSARLLQFNNHINDAFLKRYIDSNFDEMVLSISLAKFISLYCYPFDDIYKKDNNYHINREDRFDFSKLDLTGFNPEIIDLTKKGEVEANERIKSLTKEKDNLIEYQKKLMKDIENISKKPEITPHLNNVLEKLKNDLNNVNESIRILLNEWADAVIYCEEVKKDYNKNNDYFRNLAIIEGMRNSIAHGNVKITNIASAKNKFDLNIQFTNIHEGKECFKMNVSIYDLEILFTENNIKLIDNYVNKINNEKVLKK